MDYHSLSVHVTSPEVAEIVTALLADLPYESFDNNSPEILLAYIQSAQLTDGVRCATAEILEQFGLTEYRFESIAAQNWNAEWERGFTPVRIGSHAVIRAPYHEPCPDCAMEIIITPRMAFGSGHHATTCMLVGAILDARLEGLCGADIGCGTGVLAIAAAKCGARSVDAVDIDDAAVENAEDNIRDNGVEEVVHTFLGTVGVLAGRHYDFIFANINRNILLGDMPAYATALNGGGRLFMSGFYSADIQTLVEAASSCGLTLSHTRTTGDWAALEFYK